MALLALVLVGVGIAYLNGHKGLKQSDDEAHRFFCEKFPEDTPDC